MQAIGGMTRENAFIWGLQDCQFLFEFSILPATSLRPLTQTDRPPPATATTEHQSGAHHVDQHHVHQASTRSMRRRSWSSIPAPRPPGPSGARQVCSPTSIPAPGRTLGSSGRAPWPASLPHQHQSQPHSARPRRPVTPRNLRTLPTSCNAHLKSRLLANNQGGLDFSTGQWIKVKCEFRM